MPQISPWPGRGCSSVSDGRVECPLRIGASSPHVSRGYSLNLLCRGYTFVGPESCPAEGRRGRSPWVICQAQPRRSDADQWGMIESRPELNRWFQMTPPKWSVICCDPPYRMLQNNPVAADRLLRPCLKLSRHRCRPSRRLSRWNVLGESRIALKVVRRSDVFDLFVKKLWNATAARGQEFSWLPLVRIEFKIFHCSLELSLFSSIFRRVNSACFRWRSCLCISNADFQLSRVSGVFSRHHNRSNRRIVRFDLLQSVSYHLATRPTRQRKLQTGACLSARASSTVSYKSKSWTGSSLVVEYNSEFIRSSLNLIGSIFFQDRFETNWGCWGSLSIAWARSSQMSSVLVGLSLSRRWLLHWTMSSRHASNFTMACSRLFVREWW